MKRMIAIVGALLITAALLYVLACDDNSTGPKPEPEEKDYMVWMKEGMDPGWIYGYHPLTNVVDSFYWLTDGRILVSADGQWLYGKPVDSTMAAAVSLDSIQCSDTLRIDHMLPFAHIIAVSPDNRYLAVIPPDGGFSILRAADYSVVFSDTDRVAEGHFRADNRRFYGGAVHVDLEGTPKVIRRWSCPFGALYSLVPSDDESAWYLMLKISPFCDFRFMAYDPIADSVLFTDYLVPGFGEIEIGPDPWKVIYTNSDQGCFSNCPFPAPFFHVYDTKTNTADDTVWTIGACAEQDPVPISEVQFTADGKWLVAMHMAFNVILVYDAKTLEYRHCSFLGRGHCLHYLTTQTIP